MDISKLQFGQLSAKLNISKKFEDLDVNKDNKINAEDVLSASDSETLEVLNQVLSSVDEDSALEDDVEFDLESLNNMLKSGAAGATQEKSADVQQKNNFSTENLGTPTLNNGKYYLNNKPYTGVYNDTYYEKGVKSKGTKLYNNVLYVKGEKAKGDVLYKNILYTDGVKSSGYQIYKKMLYADGVKSKGTVLYNDTLFINGKRASGTKLHENTLYVNGQKATGNKLYKNKLYTDGVIATGEVKFKNKMYKDGELLTGLADTDGKYYKKGKLHTGEADGLYYKKGVAYENKKDKTPYTGTINGLTFENGIVVRSNVETESQKDEPETSVTSESTEEQIPPVSLPLYNNGSLVTGVYKGQTYINGMPYTVSIEKPSNDKGYLDVMKKLYLAQQGEDENWNYDTSLDISEKTLAIRAYLVRFSSYGDSTSELSKDFKSDVEMVMKADNFAKAVQQDALQKGKSEAEAKEAYQSAYNEYISSQMVKDGTQKSDAQILASTSAGDVIEKSDGIYVNDNGKLIKLNMTKEQYIKLLPPVERYNTQQGALGDCYLVSSTLYGLMNNPKTFAKMLRMVSIDNNTGDVTIKFTGSLKDYPVTFSNGELYTDVGVSGSPFVQYIEQAFALADFAWEKDKDLSVNDIQQAMSFIGGGGGPAGPLFKIFDEKNEDIAQTDAHGDKVNRTGKLWAAVGEFHSLCNDKSADEKKEIARYISELFANSGIMETNQPAWKCWEDKDYMAMTELIYNKVKEKYPELATFVSQLSSLGADAYKQIYEVLKTGNTDISSSYLDQIAEDVNKGDFIVTASTSVKEGTPITNSHGSMLVNAHVYSIESIDTVNKTLKIVNPWQCRQTMTITYDEFAAYFGIEAIVDTKKY